MIRPARKSDTEAIRAISAQVFAQFGDYGTFLPRYLDDAWVETAVDEEAGCIRGFIMLALAPSRRPRSGPIADMLAIAVAPGQQNQGLGAALLTHAVALASRLREQYDVREIELSVADTNVAAQRFFRRHGFRVVDATEGRYPAGQTAMRMARTIDPG